MKYFLTGATGFLGNVLALQLLAKGQQVNAVVRNPDKAAELKRLGASLFPGDVTDKESMRAAMQGVDGVYHMAAWFKVGAKKNRDQGEKVNVQGSRNVFELMKELRIPKGVYTSTLAVNSNTHGKLVDETYHFEGKHISEYDRTKAAAHDLAKKFIADGLPLVIVMPGLIYGPGDTSNLHTSIIDFLKGRLPMLPTQLAMCGAHVEDIAQAHILAMEKGKIGETYIIAGEYQTFQEAFKLASQITGKRAPLSVPYQIANVLAVMARPFDAILPEIYTSEGLRVTAGVTYIGDNSKAKRELGYNPRPFCIGWEETLRHEMSRLEMK
jgi:nucleoside-diphosphate-sugar epimerase